MCVSRVRKILLSLGSPRQSERQNFLHMVYLSTQMFESGSLGKLASRDVLKDLIQNVLTILLDPRVNELAEGDMITRTANIFLVKTIELSDSSSVMR